MLLVPEAMEQSNQVLLLKYSVLLSKEGENTREVQEVLGWNHGPLHPSSVALDKLLNPLSLISHICKMRIIKLGC